MSLSNVLTISFLISCGLCILDSSHASKQVLADVTNNKLTREHDGTWGLWSYHGVAKESHASRTSFIFNADLLSKSGGRHMNIASMVYPKLGLTSDQDPVYQEYLILQAKVLGIDGFLIEWGYKGHSSDTALQSFLRLAHQYSPFKIGVNWCDHWLMTELKEKTEKEQIASFHENLQYLVDTLFIHGPSRTPYVNSHPVIFLFGGGLSSSMFKELIALPLKLPEKVQEPIWVGSYLNFASTDILRKEWRVQINGTFGWAPYILKPTPPTLNAWDYYGDLPDVLEYQKNVSSYGEQCVAEGDCLLWCGSMSPRFDNRGCAGWGRELRLIPRKDLKTQTRLIYSAQWDYYIQRNLSTNLIVLPTMNDYLESTPILASNDSVTTLYSTLNHINEWKATQIDESGVPLPMEWYKLHKDVEYYEMTPGLNVSNFYEYLEAASLSLDAGNFSKAAQYLEICRSKIEFMSSSLQSNNITVLVPSPSLCPSIAPVTVNDSYIINSTVGLYLTLDDTTTKALIDSNYKALMHFQFLSLNSSLNHFKVFSPSKRKNAFNNNLFFVRQASFNLKVKEDAESIFRIAVNFAEVCNLVTNSSGVWQNATVELFKKNQSWNHSGPYNSDLYFESEGTYLVQNIALQFQLIRKEIALGVT